MKPDKNRLDKLLWIDRLCNKIRAGLDTILYIILMKVTNTYTYENDFLKSITHNGFSYYFDYNQLGNIEKVRIGDRQLAKYFCESVPYEPWFAYTSLFIPLKLVEQQRNSLQEISATVYGDSI